MTASPLLLVGVGNMGGALLKGWVKSGIEPGRITVIDPNSAAALNTEAALAVTVLPSPDALPGDYRPAAIVFAVKPQSLDDILPLYAARFREQTPLILSIAAGKTAGYFADFFPGCAIVRAMPNLPALIGKGVTALYTAAAAAARAAASPLLEALGKIVWVEEESQMDIVTALSGSGPAYAFYFIECLTEAAVEAGMARSLAEMLAVHTVHGASHMALAADDSLSTLRRNVTSPGGTTEAAMAVLEKDRAFYRLLQSAMAHAEARAKILSS